MSARKPKPRGHPFAPGNKAAAKGEPRTVTFSCRLPRRLADKLADLAGSDRTRADVICALIERE